jgi:hypothetical protein
MRRAWMLDADALLSVAAQLTREEAGRLLAPLCRAGAALVRAADAAEDAGQPEMWRGGRPMWGIHRVCARIDARWAGDLPGLAEVLKSLARTIESLVEYDAVERVFERREARARRQASVLGCHRLLVLDAAHFLWHMEDWTRRKCRDESAQAAVRVYGNAKEGNAKEGNAKEGNAKEGNAKEGNAKEGNAKEGSSSRRTRSPPTQLVLNLLGLLGLQVRRGRGMRFPPDPHIRPVDRHLREPLWNREYVAQRLSARGV